MSEVISSREGGSDHSSIPPNRLLLAMDAGARAALDAHLERVELAVHDVLAEPGESFEYVVFPETAVVSVVNYMSDGSAVEVGTAGNEGMFGIAAFLQAGASESKSFCQIPGSALRLPVHVLIEAAASHPTLRRLLNRYTQAYMTQVAQNAACNRLHSIEPRCARWLLMTHDRVQHHQFFPLKQEFLALMLGVRRAGVSIAAGTLQSSGLIKYRRGGIRVLDRAGLEAASCECYSLVRRHFDRLLPQPMQS